MSLAPEHADPIYRVVVVDDSAVIRSATTQALNGDLALRVIGSAANGQLAIDLLRKEPADVVVLDIEMPVMDGLTALPHLKAIDPALQIIMSSTLTQANAEISLQAMALGATDYIPKPTSLDHGAEVFKQELIAKVRALGAVARRKGVRLPPGIAPATPKPGIAPTGGKTFALRHDPILRPEVIAIGSSTGGPQALFTTIKKLGNALPQPILITQHMPPSFTTTLAQHITRNCKVMCSEAANGEVLKPGQYYVAPGDFHLLTTKINNQLVAKLGKQPPENFCRPSVDPMLRSLATIYGKRTLVIILTGMGVDGCAGAATVVAAGGAVIAQNEATSVVWGMPGAVAMAGLCSAVLPIEEIGTFANQLALRSKL